MKTASTFIIISVLIYASAANPLPWWRPGKPETSTSPASANTIASTATTAKTVGSSSSITSASMSVKSATSTAIVTVTPPYLTESYGLPWWASSVGTRPVSPASASASVASVTGSKSPVNTETATATATSSIRIPATVIRDIWRAPGKSTSTAKPTGAVSTKSPANTATVTTAKTATTVSSTTPSCGTFGILRPRLVRGQ